MNSILDTDLYKLSMQKAVLAYKNNFNQNKNIPVEYVFVNRKPESTHFGKSFSSKLAQELDKFPDIQLSDEEADWLRTNVPFLGDDYIEYLKNYRFDLQELEIYYENDQLNLKINGPWERTILWEVPLMATISEAYFETCDLGEVASKARIKADILKGCKFADFGTRRRRSYAVQELIVKTLKESPDFVGTSNVHFAQKFNLKAIGTMAHEWIMGISALEGLRHANKDALKIWSQVFNGRLGVALTDTFGSDAFFNDFDSYMSRLFDGMRHDSGDPIVFAEKAIAHYKKVGVDPTTKTIVFSDGLTPDIAASIRCQLQDRIRTSFGIGTNFTNDFNEPPLNMVIKLWKCNGVPVVKLSDTPSKQIGNRDALRVANWTFFDHPLD